MSVSTVRLASVVSCPAWCRADHADPYAVDHVRMAGVVLRDAHLESVAVEVEQGCDRGWPPRIVVSVFTQETLESMNADLTVAEARRAYAALGAALDLVDGAAE